MIPAYIAFGSNMGDRNKNIEKALEYLKELEGLVIKNVSNIYETDPVGCPDHNGSPQDKFLNGVIGIETLLPPDELLNRLNGIESRLGRVRTEGNGPRPIDLDIIFYDDVVIGGGRLKIPHPKMQEREFVLRGLVEIAPDFVHPRLGKTVKQLYDELNTANENNKVSQVNAAGEPPPQAAG